MKKLGFTLAEVLITLSIIGVVSALVIPQFVSNAYDQSNASKLSSIVSDYENIFGHMLLREDRENIYETEFGTEYNQTIVNITNIQNSLEPYAKVSSIGNTWASVGYTALCPNNYLMPAAVADNNQNYIHNISGTLVAVDFKFALSTSGGAVLIFSDVETVSGHDVGTIYIDVNGSAMPNRFGRDVFAFVLLEDGHLYPYGSREASQALGVSSTPTWQSTNDNTHGCTSGSYDGRGCTARLIENNYKMDY